jgi:hypothetical protein
VRYWGIRTPEPSMGRLFFVPANSSILSVVGAHQHPELLLTLYLPRLPARHGLDREIASAALIRKFPVCPSVGRHHEDRVLLMVA